MRLFRLFLCVVLLAACSETKQKNTETTEPTVSTDTESAQAAQSEETAEKPESPLVEAPGIGIKNVANFSSIENYQPGRSSKELSVATFLAKLGKPDSTIRDTSGNCPVGYLHFWHIIGQNCRIFALGDNYTPKENPKASCRVYGIQILDPMDKSPYPGFLGVQLGDDASVIKEKLEAYVKENPTYNFQKVDRISPVERFLVERQKYVYIVTDGEKFYHFSIGKRQKLSYILIASINVIDAC